MGTSLCDVTVTLKRQGKIVNIFFLNQDTYFYKKIYVWHFYQKMHTELHSGLHYMVHTIACVMLKQQFFEIETNTQNF